MNAPFDRNTHRLVRNPRIATEVCKGMRYPCMGCGTVKHDVLWEYDLDRREVLAVTCLNHDACEARRIAKEEADEAAYLEHLDREADRATYQAAHEGGWA